VIDRAEAVAGPGIFDPDLPRSHAASHTSADNEAPMPNMNRLTPSGVALPAGSLYNSKTVRRSFNKVVDYLKVRVHIQPHG
jgi:hypothetical protein